MKSVTSFIYIYIYTYIYKQYGVANSREYLKSNPWHMGWAGLGWADGLVVEGGKWE